MSLEGKPQTPTFTVGQPPLQGQPTRRQIASLSRRTGAMLVDATITLPLGLLALVPIRLVRGDLTNFSAGWLHTPTGDSTAGQLTFAAAEYAIFVLVWLLYAALLTGRSGPHNGQTLGKQATGIQITDRDGGPLTRTTAWLRALLLGALLTLPIVAGLLIDAALSAAPTLSNAGMALGSGLSALVVATALAGRERRTLHDRLAGTVVATTVPSAAPLADPGIDERAVEPRTWALGGLVVLGSLVAAALTLAAPTWFTGNPERAREIMAMPETKEAHRQLALLEREATDCLASTNGDATGCEVTLPERAALRELDWVEGSFDLEADPVGQHAGKVTVIAADGALMLYVFTAADRTWSSSVNEHGVEGWSRVCLPKSGDFCEGIFDWPGWD